MGIKVTNYDDTVGILAISNMLSCKITVRAEKCSESENETKGGANPILLLPSALCQHTITTPNYYHSSLLTLLTSAS